jgi:hypothetical protein
VNMTNIITEEKALRDEIKALLDEIDELMRLTTNGATRAPLTHWKSPAPSCARSGTC